MVLENKKIYLGINNNQTKWLIVSKFKELSVDLIWAYIKEIDELNLYFPDFSRQKSQKKNICELYRKSLCRNPKMTKNSIIFGGVKTKATKFV